MSETGTESGEERYFGRMNDPTGCGIIRGPCGEEMEMYLCVRDGTIEEAKCYTEGCGVTLACGLETAKLARGRTIGGALDISALDVIDIVGELPGAERHCAILAVSALYRAIADYLLKP